MEETLKRILVTGNGFDISHYLPTSYKHFIEVVKKLDKGNTQELKEFLYELEVANQKIRYYYNLGNLAYDKIIKSYKVVINKNSDGKKLVDYFKSISTIQGWVDFESEIKTIVRVIDGIREFEIKCEAVPIFSKDYNYFIYSDTEESKVKEAQLEEINKILRNLQLFGDRRFNKELKNLDNNGLNYDKVFEVLYEAVKQLEKIFNWYLVNIIDKILCNPKAVKRNEILLGIDYHINFNYTNTIDKLYSEKIINGKSHYIHGKHKSEEEERNLLFGYHYEYNYNHYQERETKYSRPLTKVFKRIHYETDYTAVEDIYKDITQDELTVESKLNNVEIIFWGHSLDVTDKDIISKLIRLIDIQSPLNSKVIIKYHDIKSKANMLNNLFEILEKGMVEHYTNSKILVFEKIEPIEVLNK